LWSAEARIWLQIFGACFGSARSTQFKFQLCRSGGFVIISIMKWASLTQPSVIDCATHTYTSNTHPLGNANWQDDRLGTDFGFPNAAEYQKYSDNRSGLPLNWCWWCHLIFPHFPIFFFPFSLQKRRTMRHSYRAFVLDIGSATYCEVIAHRDTRGQRPISHGQWIMKRWVPPPVWVSCRPLTKTPSQTTPLDAPEIMQTQFSCFQALASVGNLCVCFLEGVKGPPCNYQKNTRIRGDQRMETRPLAQPYIIIPAHFPAASNFRCNFLFKLTISISISWQLGAKWKWFWEMCKM